MQCHHNTYILIPFPRKAISTPFPRKAIPTPIPIPLTQEIANSIQTPFLVPRVLANSIIPGTIEEIDLEATCRSNYELEITQAGIFYITPLLVSRMVIQWGQIDLTAQRIMLKVVYV